MTRRPEPKAAPALEITRIRVGADGYDSAGAYWGAGPDVFIATTKDARDEITVRARNQREARAKAIAELEHKPGELRARKRLGGKSPRSTRYEIVWENPVTREAVKVRITHAREYLVAGTDHIEIEAVRPKRARLPITETGYLSHFIDWQQLSAAGGPVTFVTAWLERASATKDWRRQEIARSQLDLFGWADAKDTATARNKGDARAALAAPHLRKAPRSDAMGPKPKRDDAAIMVGTVRHARKPKSPEGA